MLVKEAPGVRFNIKTPSFQYRDSHYKKWDRLIFIMEILIPEKTVFTRGTGGYYWIILKLVLSHYKWYRNNMHKASAETLVFIVRLAITTAQDLNCSITASSTSTPNIRVPTVSK